VLLQATGAETHVQTAPGQFPDYAVTMRLDEEPAVDRTDRNVDKAIRELVELETKIGGAPGWIQYDDTPACPACGGTMKFAAELEGFGEWDGSQAQYIGQNFGDAGSSYIFLCANECGPRGAAFLWQCM
jgi:hypothetical protein